MTPLPNEILSLVLYAFRPTFIVPKPRSKRSSISTQLRSRSFKQYSQSLAICAQLRLVNHAFYDALTPHLYALLIIPAKSQLQLQRCRATEYHPEMIRKVFFNGIFESGISSERKIEVLSSLKQVLGGCTNLTHIRMDLVEYRLENTDVGMIKALFQDLSTKSLTSLESWILGSRVLSAMMEGMGRETISSLKELIIHSLNASTIHHPAQEGSNFQGLEKVHIALVPFSGEPESLLNFITSILGAEVAVESPHTDSGGRITHPDSSSHITARPSVHRTTQLRELSISEGQLLPDMNITHHLYQRLLSIGNIHRSLTTLRLRLRPPRPNHVQEISLPQFDAFPEWILEFCPLVTRFHFLTWCPVSFLYRLPERIVELGVRIAERSQFNRITTLSRQAQILRQRNSDLHPFPSTALHTLDPLIEVVSTPEHRKGLERLYIEWGSRNRNVDAEEKLRGACERARIEFYNAVDW